MISIYILSNNEVFCTFWRFLLKLFSENIATNEINFRLTITESLFTQIRLGFIFMFALIIDIFDAFENFNIKCDKLKFLKENI